MWFYVIFSPRICGRMLYFPLINWALLYISRRCCGEILWILGVLMVCQVHLHQRYLPGPTIIRYKGSIIRGYIYIYTPQKDPLMFLVTSTTGDVPMISQTNHPVKSLSCWRCLRSLHTTSNQANDGIKPTQSPPIAFVQCSHTRVASSRKPRF